MPAGTPKVSSPAAVASEEHGVRGAVVPKPLTAAEQKTLTSQLAIASTVAKKFPTVKDALAAGYMMSTPYVPCIGAHYTNIGLATHFDPATPSELLYAGTAPDAKIVGLSYLVYHGDGPPPGFAGPNDLWHQHNANGGLCLRGAVVILGEESTRAQCAAAGGRKTLLSDVWMLHAWIVPNISCPWGVFSGECPALGGRLGGTMFDVAGAADLVVTFSRAATRPRCATIGSPSRRARRARRASRCPGPSRGPAARG